MLGFSGGEVALIVFVGLVTFGPKDIPKIARAAGRLAGRGMGYLFTFRERITGMADRAELLQLHTELRQTMAQLEAIRAEALHRSQILPPVSSFAARAVVGPSPTRQVYAQAESAPEEHASGAGRQGSAGAGAAAHAPGMEVRPGHSGQVRDHASGHREPSTARELGKREVGLEHGHGGEERQGAPAQYKDRDIGVLSARPQEALPAPNVGAEPKEASVSGSDSISEAFRVIPISALSAGLIPKRPGSRSASELVLDAIAEARVAEQAAAFLTQEEHKQAQE